MVSGPVSWSGGTKIDAGTLTAGGGMTISGAGAKALESGTVDNPAGQTTVINGTGGIIVDGGGTFSNEGTVDDQVDLTFSNASGISSFCGSPNGSFSNRGTFTKSGGAGATRFCPTAFNNSGQVNVNSGTLSLVGGQSTGGSFAVAAGSTLNFGSFGGVFGSAPYAFDGSSSVTGAGAVSFNGDAVTFASGATYTAGSTTLSDGSVTFNNTVSTDSYTQTGGTLGINLGGTASCSTFGQVNVAGVATLGGALSVGVTNGCSPSSTQFFQIMNYASHSGTFASVSTPTVNGQSMPVSYFPTNVTVGATGSLGKIVVKKVTDPSPDPTGTQFTFNPTGYNGNAPFQLADGKSNDSGSLAPGSGYKVTESPTAGWTLTSASCDNGNDPTSGITVSAGQTVTCTFKNQAQGKIVVKKVTDPSPDPTGTQFTFNPTGYNGNAPFQLADGKSNDSGSLAPGSGYKVTESPTAGWTLTSASCDNGNDPTSGITVSAGQTVTCTFKNQAQGKIVVKKVTDPSPDPTGTQFTFNPTGYNGNAPFQLADGKSNDSGSLAPGSGYKVTESPTAGWTLTSASCDNGNDPTSGITVSAGQTVTCTFKNTDGGQARVVKTVNGASLSGTQYSFAFQLRRGASTTAAGTILETGTANATDNGVITFATLLVPGQMYQLCEQLQAGWMTTLGPPLYSVYNPSADNSVVCTDFSVSPGQTLVFSIDNKPPPGGIALTIGYWKNWSSCSGGKQKPVLDQTLLKLANAGTPETLGKLVLNPLTLGATTACQYAVETLNKSTITGTKMSSDPLFNMASQLLGADLNAAAGTGQCSASATAINTAHALLTKYGFDGKSSASQLKVTSADATTANTLATTLANYNNDRLC